MNKNINKSVFKGLQERILNKTRIFWIYCLHLPRIIFADAIRYVPTSQNGYMWHLIGIRNKKDWQRGEERLKELGMNYHGFHQLFQLFNTHTTLVQGLSNYGKECFFLVDDSTGVDMVAFATKEVTLFERKRISTENRKYIALTDNELDQLMKVLQTPVEYRISRVNRVPDSEELQSYVIPYGPLKGVQGKILYDRTPHGKRFYVSLCQIFHFEIRIPKEDVKLSKQQEKIELAYLLDDQTPRWYVLTAHKQRYIDAAFEGSLNTYPHEEGTNLQVANIENPHTGEPMEVVRYLYQAIYREKDKDGKITETNLMPNHYFVKTTRWDLETFRNRCGYDTRIYILRCGGKKPMVIPNHEMEAFCKFINERSAGSEVLLQDYKAGDTITIAMGIEKSNEITGVIQLVTNKHYVVLTENGITVKLKVKK